MLIVGLPYKSELYGRFEGKIKALSTPFMTQFATRISQYHHKQRHMRDKFAIANTLFSRSMLFHTLHSTHIHARATYTECRISFYLAPRLIEKRERNLYEIPTPS